MTRIAGVVMAVTLAAAPAPTLALPMLALPMLALPTLAPSEPALTALALTAAGTAARPSAPPAHRHRSRPVPVAAAPGPVPGCPASRLSVPRPTGQPWAQRALGLSSVWPLSRGLGVTVAVVDSGVDYSPQLAGRVSAIDLTGTGLRDCLGSGTAVAAIIAAGGLTSRGIRFAGVAPLARILSVKVTSSGQVSSARLAEGIRDAAALGAQVIDVPVTAKDSPQLRAAVNDAVHRNCLVVAAATSATGGTGGNGGTRPGFPASYPGVLSVGAVSAHGSLAPFTDPRAAVSVTAPGTGITSAWPGGYRTGLEGTAYASAFVSGVAALVIAHRPNIGASTVLSRIVRTADGGDGPGSGAGLVNPAQAMTGLIAPGGAPAATQGPPVSIARPAAPGTGATRTALAVTAASLAAALLAVIGAVVARRGRRRRWRPGRVEAGGPGTDGKDVPRAELAENRQGT